MAVRWSAAAGRFRHTADAVHLGHHGDLDLDSGLDGHGGNVLDGVRGGLEVDQALVHAHRVAVPRLGTLTARRTAGGDAQLAGGHAHGALDGEVGLLRVVHQLRAHCNGRRGTR